jgi:hypothetical protein
MTERCKVGFESQSPIISSCGACHAPPNAVFGGWARGKYRILVRSLALLGLPVFRKHRFVVVIGKWVIELWFNDRVDGLGRIAGGGQGMLEPS